MLLTHKYSRVSLKRVARVVSNFNNNFRLKLILQTTGTGDVGRVLVIISHLISSNVCIFIDYDYA